MFSLSGGGQPLLSIDRLDAEKAPVLSYLPTLDFYLQHSIFTSNTRFLPSRSQNAGSGDLASGRS